MIKVNLLSSVPGATPVRNWFPKEQRSAMIGIGALAATALTIAGFWLYLHHQNTVLNGRIEAARAEIVRLKEAAKLVEKTTARKNELTERLALIERLRAAKRAPVSLLETVSRSVPDGLWLLEIKQSGVTVQVEGRAMSLNSVTDFAERLQNSGLFERPVEIVTTTSETLEEMSIVRFLMKAEAARPVAPAPAPAVAPSNSAASVTPAASVSKAGA